MKAFKHILSYACDKNCSYCINEILVHNEKQCKDQMKIAERYQEMAKWGYDHIMISGGEPYLNKMFEPCVRIAKMHFKHISIISASADILKDYDIQGQIDDILFSFHIEYLDPHQLPEVLINKPVYASMVVETYNAISDAVIHPMRYIKDHGYAGVTIRECYPDGVELPEDLPDQEGLSIRTYKKENCVADNMLMLPDLSLTTQSEFS